MRERSSACQYPPKRSVGNNEVLILDRQQMTDCAEHLLFEDRIRGVDT
jgi:hypothetical protein